MEFERQQIVFYWLPLSISLSALCATATKNNKSNVDFMGKHLMKPETNSCCPWQFPSFVISYIAHFKLPLVCMGCNHCSLSNNTGTSYRLPRRHTADHGGILYLNYALDLHYWEHNCCQGTAMMSMQLHWYCAVSALSKRKILTMQNSIKMQLDIYITSIKGMFDMNQMFSLKDCRRI